MSNQLIQYAFTAGEISPRLFGRSDLEKFDLGLAEATNWFVDYRGGISTRPGMEFLDYLQYPDNETRSFRFQFSPDTSNAYTVVFGHQYIRFFQDGGYVLESAVNISDITEADPGVVTANSHGYSDGDWVKVFDVVGMTEVNSRIFEVSNSTTHTFELKDVHGDDFDTSGLTAYDSGGTVQRVYTISNPYTHTDLERLKAYQIRDVLRLTHPDYPIKNLTRSDHTSWSIANETIGNPSTRPTVSSHSVGTAGTAGVLFCVTAVFADGSESLRSDYYYVDDTNDYSVSAGFVTIVWGAVTGAVSYRVYRSIIVNANTELNNSMTFGYVGAAVGPQFTDNNLIPDFAQAPPASYNPFAIGPVTGITITAGGSSYASATTSVSASGGGGSGFIGLPIIVGGIVVGVYILHPGEGYTSAPTITITDSGSGTGAAATASIGDQSGMHPTASALFQQRQIYAGSDNSPLTLWGSKPGQLSNFDASDIVVTDDGYEFELDANTVAPIRHLINMRGGLLLMSAAGIWQLTGGGNLAVTATNAFAEPQTYFGASDIEPFNVDTDILYVTEKESTVRLLAYNDFSKLYGGTDMSILSSHLFSRMNKIVRWAYIETPFRVAWCIREDGTMLAFTIVKEQNVYAWTPCQTKGVVKDVVSLVEDNVDVGYVTVNRTINGKNVKLMERFAEREIEYVEDAICVDSALTLGGTTVNATLTIEAVSGDDIEFVAGSSVFASGDVGKIIRAGGCKARVKTYNSGTSVDCTILRPVADIIPETTTPKVVAANAWTMDALVTTISGLSHLEGETVAVLVDGNVIPNKTVTNGTISLGVSGTRVSVGIPFTAKAKTLPYNVRDVVIEGRRKRTYGAAIRRHETRGLQYGTSYAKTYDVKERTTELYGEPVQLQSDSRYFVVSGKWDESGQMVFLQDKPLPASILGIVPDIEVGDDTD